MLACQQSMYLWQTSNLSVAPQASSQRSNVSVHFRQQRTVQSVCAHWCRAPVHQVLRELAGMPCLEALHLSASHAHEARHQSYAGLTALTGLTQLCLYGARSFGDAGAACNTLAAPFLSCLQNQS